MTLRGPGGRVHPHPACRPRSREASYSTSILHPAWNRRLRPSTGVGAADAKPHGGMNGSVEFPLLGRLRPPSISRNIIDIRLIIRKRNRLLPPLESREVLRKGECTPTHRFRSTLAAALLALLFATAPARAQDKEVKKLPAFSLKTAGGETVSARYEADDFMVAGKDSPARTKAVLVHFFQPDCNACLVEMKALEGLHQELAPQEVRPRHFRSRSRFAAGRIFRGPREPRPPPPSVGDGPGESRGTMGLPRPGAGAGRAGERVGRRRADGGRLRMRRPRPETPPALPGGQGRQDSRGCGKDRRAIPEARRRADPPGRGGRGGESIAGCIGKGFGADVGSRAAVRRADRRGDGLSAPDD